MAMKETTFVLLFPEKRLKGVSKYESSRKEEAGYIEYEALPKEIWIFQSKSVFGKTFKSKAFEF